MSQSSNEQSPFGNWPSAFMVAILLALGAIGLVQAPFKSERPNEAEPGRGPVGTQDVEARLWQDPFAAVWQARKESQGTESECRTLELGNDGRSLLVSRACNQRVASRDSSTPRYSLAELRELIRSRADQIGREWDAAPKNPPLTVLGIMIDAGNLPGAAERRRRYRYAALSALMLEGFLPDDSQHIGYAELGSDGPPALLPYEWFTRDIDEHKQKLILLWLDDASLDSTAPGTTAATAQPQPLAHLSGLLSKLLSRDSAANRVGFELIGPANSETLIHMAEEYLNYTASPHLVAQQGQHADWPVARIWSPFATIENPFGGPPFAYQSVYNCRWKSQLELEFNRIFQPLVRSWSSIAVFDSPFNAPEANLTYKINCSNKEQAPCVAIQPPGRNESTIVPDKVLMCLLADELVRRGVTGPARIALIYQWDTEYSRGLFKLMEDALKNRPEVQRPLHPERLVELYSYMRGIDGLIPGTKPKDRGEPDSKTVERAESDAQTDYLRRLRDALLAEDTRLRRVCGFTDRIRQRCGVRAIGVLGDDYYDKLLVLQALRPVFPGTVFFTTDLTADMLNPRDMPFTRNLVVASGFGLSLATIPWQREVPPLRDVYQTSLLFAVRLAVQDSLGMEPEVTIPPPPRLFEIGRTRAVELLAHSDSHSSVGFQRGEVPNKLDAHPAAELGEFFRLLPEGHNQVLSSMGAAST